MEKKTKKKILVNARYKEEKRVAIIEGETLIDFSLEATGKEHLKGNIYKGTVVKLVPGLQAAFIDFGQKRHGFLQMKEISPEYLPEKAEGKKPKIQEMITKGREMIVQVEKEERDTKGASLTTYISIPGRYMVMMPGQSSVGISRKVESKEERDRLKELLTSLALPENIGFILRTAGMDKTKRDLLQDLKYLTTLWEQIRTDAINTGAPALIYQEQDIAVRMVRDYLTSDVHEVIVDQEDAYKDIKAFLRKTMPWRRINVRYYKEKEPLFSKHKIEEQLRKINERYIYLPSGGYLVFDKTEALTTIDVNSGRSKKDENVESTAFRTNIEAAGEVARQLRLRDIGGLIVIDFIDMQSSKNRKEVEKQFAAALRSDKANTETSGISRFGMMEMTRERLRQAYGESAHRKCEVCSGTGVIRRDETIALAALREIHAKAAAGSREITCRLPVESLNFLINTQRSEIADIEKDFGTRVLLQADLSLAPGQYTVNAEGIHPPAQQKAEARAQTKSRGRGASEPEDRETVQEAEGGIAGEMTQADAPEEALPEAPSSGGERAGTEKKKKHRRSRRPRRRGKSGQKPGAQETPPEAAETSPVPDGAD